MLNLSSGTGAEKKVCNSHTCVVKPHCINGSTGLARQQAIAQGSRPAGPEPFALADSRWGPEAKWNISLEKKRVVRGTVWHNVKGVQGTALKSVGPGIFRWWQHDREDQARSAIVPKIYARGRTQAGPETRQQDPEQGDNGCDSVPLPLYEA